MQSHTAFRVEANLLDGAFHDHVLRDGNEVLLVVLLVGYNRSPTREKLMGGNESDTLSE